MRLEHLDGGAVIVVIVRRDERLHVADVTYGDSLTDTEVHWTDLGTMEIQQYKRDHWNSKIYPEIARWRGGRR